MWNLYYWTQVSQLGTGSFILMYSILMKLVLLGAPLNCAEANELLSLVNPFDPNRLEMTKVIIAHTDPVCFEDAQVDWRNGIKTAHYFRRNQMAQVTYRGVKYDTNNKTAQQKKEVELTYRGIAHTAK